MVRRRAQQDSSEDSSGSEASCTVQLPCYQQLELQAGVTSRLQRVRIQAVRELTALLKAFYPSKASKVVQQAMFADILAAVASLDRSASSQNAMLELVRVAKKVLPQQKQQQLQSEHKRACLALARQTRNRSVACDEDEEYSLKLDELPREVLLVILQQVDPVTLASLSCCSSQWHKLASGDELWQPWCCRLFPTHAHQQPPTSTSSSHLRRNWYSTFRDCLQGAHVLKQGLTGQRVFLDGRPMWRPTSSLPSLMVSQPPLTGLMATPDKIVTWLLKGSTRSQNPSSGDDSSSSDSDGEGVACRRQLKLWSL